MERKFIFNKEKLHEDIDSLARRVDKLNIAIDSKNSSIKNLKKEFEQLKKIYKIVNTFAFKIFEPTPFIYSLERGIKELDIIIKVESLNKKLIEEMREENNVLK